jgi:VWFA-related protein
MRLRVGAVFVAVLTVAALDAQGPTFSSRVDGVRVDVLVTQGGRPVRGLGREDFDIWDNDVRQRVDVVSTGQAPVNVVLALDLSDSVQGRRLVDLRAAGAALLDGLGHEDRAGLLTFDHEVRLRSRLTNDRSAVREALATADAAGGATALVDATFAAIAVGESDVGRSLLVVFSDGIDTSSWLAPADVIDAARRGDVVVYAVSSAASSRRFLHALTVASGGQLLTEPQTERLASTFRAILEEFRDRYLVTFTPRGVAKDGWHKLEVRVKSRWAKVQARPGYLGRS